MKFKEGDEVLHKSDEAFRVFRPCDVFINSFWVKGYLYGRSDIMTGKIFVPTADDFERDFKLNKVGE